MGAEPRSQGRVGNWDMDMDLGRTEAVAVRH